MTESAKVARGPHPAPGGALRSVRCSTGFGRPRVAAVAALALLLVGCGRFGPAGSAGAVAAHPPAAAVEPANPAAPYPTIMAPSTFQAMSPGALTSLEASLEPELAADQVQLPSGTPSPMLPPPGGWLPRRRIVAYYGNPLSPAMGVLGWYPAAQDMARLLAQAAAYTRVDPAQPALPAIDLVADVAQASPGPHGAYRRRMPYSLLNQELTLARQYHALLILEIQVGRSTVAQELPYFLPYLAQPDVELALDPEFDMPPGEIPGKWIGTMSAAEINWAIAQMSDLVSRLHLPPKIVIVHQFTPGMVPDWRGIRVQPGVQFVMDTDGFGGQALKKNNYRRYIADQPIPPVRYGGIKLFYKYDTGLMTPTEVVALQPPPSLVIYQ